MFISDSVVVYGAILTTDTDFIQEALAKSQRSRLSIRSRVSTVSEQTKENLDREQLRLAIQEEYKEVALHPDQGFHFHTGRKLAGILGYEDEWLENIPADAVDSFAGTGNPFRIGELQEGEKVVDMGCGAGIDTLIAGHKVGSSGKAIGIDMTDAMLNRARSALKQTELDNVEFRQGYAEDMPVESGWADVIISNGVFNLMPDKLAVLKEMHRILSPEGRLQIADILVTREVPDSAKRKMDLWTG